jgi:hypothetical protein
MSLRGYFSLRYTVPGYAFILIVVAINYVPIMELLRGIGVSDAYAIFLGFLSLVTGSALGFLLTQYYWWRFREKGGLFSIDEFAKVEQFLVNDFQYIPPNDRNERRRTSAAILDFLIYIGDKPLIEYLWRRWDMYNLLSSTAHVLRLGLFVGAAYRIFFEYYFFRKAFWGYESLRGYLSFGNAEGVALTLIFIGVVALSIICSKSGVSIINEYCPMLEAIARDSMKKNEARVREAFHSRFAKHKEDRNISGREKDESIDQKTEKK